MQEKFSFKKIGVLPLFLQCLATVEQLTEDDWRNYKDRKRRGGIAAENTDTIPITYNPDQSSTQIQRHKMFDVMEPHLVHLTKLASDVFGQVEIRQAMLTRLSAGGEIKRHRDRGPITAKSHRVHLGIKTNDQCFFTVGSETIHIPPGEAWAIDNVGKYHSVRNGGSTDRIHLIVDFIDTQ